MANETFDAYEYDEGNSPQERAEEMWLDEQEEAMRKIEGICDLEDEFFEDDVEEDEADEEEEEEAEDPFRTLAREEKEWERDYGHSGYDDDQMELLQAYGVGLSRDEEDYMNALEEEALRAEEEAMWADVEDISF